MSALKQKHKHEHRKRRKKKKNSLNCLVLYLAVEIKIQEEIVVKQKINKNKNQVRSMYKKRWSKIERKRFEKTVLWPSSHLWFELYLSIRFIDIVLLSCALKNIYVYLWMCMLALLNLFFFSSSIFSLYTMFQCLG